MRSAAGEGGGWSSRSLHVKTDSRQGAVLAILIASIVLFSITGRNFLSLDNFFEGVRLSAEIVTIAAIPADSPREDRPLPVFGPRELTRSVFPLPSGRLHIMPVR